MISDRLKEIWAELPQGVRLVAVSKYHPVERLQEAYVAGQRLFGENHAQELAAKAVQMPADTQWHMIGHLQTNKVKQIISSVSMIHSVDSVRLLREIEKQAAKVGRCVDCLLQLHVAQEETKFGLTPSELLELLEAGEWRDYTHVHLCGIMCMATNTDNVEQVRREFRQARHVFEEVKQRYFNSDESFCECSMGMSDDYQIAISEGATLVRIGTRIFGQREYPKP